jgi:hypothetical protein
MSCINPHGMVQTTAEFSGLDIHGIFSGLEPVIFTV